MKLWESSCSIVSDFNNIWGTSICGKSIGAKNKKTNHWLTWFPNLVSSLWWGNRGSTQFGSASIDWVHGSGERRWTRGSWLSRHANNSETSQAGRNGTLEKKLWVLTVESKALACAMLSLHSGGICDLLVNKLFSLSGHLFSQLKTKEVGF